MVWGVKESMIRSVGGCTREGFDNGSHELVLHLVSADTIDIRGRRSTADSAFGNAIKVSMNVRSIKKIRAVFAQGH